MPKAKRKYTKRGTQKTTTAKKPKSTIKAKVARTAVATGSENIVQVMQAHHSELLTQQADLDAQITAFENAMGAIGATASTSATSSTGKKRGRPVGSGGKKGTLKSYIQRVFGKVTKPLSPRQIAERVEKAGYKSKSASLTRAVSNTLPKVKGVKRLGHGKYQMGG